MKQKIIVLSALVATCIVLGCMGSGGQLGGGTTSTGSTGATTTTGGTTNGTTTTGTTSTTGTTTSGGGGGTVNVSATEAMTFSPQITTAHAGDTIVWTNTSTDMLHTVTSDNGQSGLDSSVQFPSGIPEGSTFSWTVPANATVGTNFFYHCAFHGFQGNGSSMGFGMAGEISVN